MSRGASRRFRLPRSSNERSKSCIMDFLSRLPIFILQSCNWVSSSSFPKAPFSARVSKKSKHNKNMRNGIGTFLFERFTQPFRENTHNWRKNSERLRESFELKSSKMFVFVFPPLPFPVCQFSNFQSRKWDLEEFKRIVRPRPTGGEAATSPSCSLGSRAPDGICPLSTASQIASIFVDSFGKHFNSHLLTLFFLRNLAPFFGAIWHPFFDTFFDAIWHLFLTQFDTLFFDAIYHLSTAYLSLRKKAFCHVFKTTKVAIFPSFWLQTNKSILPRFPWTKSHFYPFWIE